MKPWILAAAAAVSLCASSASATNYVFNTTVDSSAWNPQVGPFFIGEDAWIPLAAANLNPGDTYVDHISLSQSFPLVIPKPFNMGTATYQIVFSHPGEYPWDVPILQVWSYDLVDNNDRFSGIDVVIDDVQAYGHDVTPVPDMIHAQPVYVPEPMTWVEMILGFFGLGALVRSRRAGRIAQA